MKKLKSLRKASGLGQYEASKRSGVERTRLSLAENGHVRLTASEHEALCGVLVQAIRDRSDIITSLLQDTQEASTAA
jgi:transcriptional regulator with XRE-family HTH domain